MKENDEDDYLLYNFLFYITYAFSKIDYLIWLSSNDNSASLVYRLSGKFLKISNTWGVMKGSSFFDSTSFNISAFVFGKFISPLKTAFTISFTLTVLLGWCDSVICESSVVP